ESKLRLIQQLGLDIDSDFTLTTEFGIFEPRWSRESLVQMAEAGHPTLRSLRARAAAQRSAARTAWSAYLPTLRASAFLSAYTRQVGDDQYLVEQGKSTLENRLENCQDFNDLNARLADPYPMQDCSGFALTDTRLDSIRGAVATTNRAFPFDFQQQPLTFSLGLSLPVFQGFSRQRQVEEAEAEAEDTEHLLRGERLRLRADVASAYLRLTTARQAVEIEETNRVVAQEQLDMARERYRVGLDSFVQLTEAETLKSEADQAYLAAVYTFHEALAELESAVGQSLRPERP
ncbi:MAG TPA: TolC family protein, partial [Longimicrobiales bacterium]|nr:TolC family protein [Longimicrobiales bacterium]